MSDVYTTLSGHNFSLKELDRQEAKFFAEFRKKFDKDTEWTEFDNYWIKALSTLYDNRKLPRRHSMLKDLYQIAQDMSSRLAIQQGYAEPPDYRDEMAVLIDRKFRTRREFCRRTGISEQLVSHALAHRKHIHPDRLGRALQKIGYRLAIAPAPAPRTASRRRKARRRSRNPSLR